MHHCKCICIHAYIYISLQDLQVTFMTESTWKTSLQWEVWSQEVHQPPITYRTHVQRLWVGHSRPAVGIMTHIPSYEDQNIKYPWEIMAWTLDLLILGVPSHTWYWREGINLMNTIATTGCLGGGFPERTNFFNKHAHLAGFLRHLQS